MVHFPVPGGGVRSFTPSRLPAYETAWAMTVHKSQGSEFDHVALVLPDTDTRVLTRELLYTGITRARRAVTVIASPDTLLRGASRTVARSSGLVERLV
jgi:exodeoxyribonuclease V alpha subunit